MTIFHPTKMTASANKAAGRKPQGLGIGTGELALLRDLEVTGSSTKGARSCKNAYAMFVVSSVNSASCFVNLALALMVSIAPLIASNVSSSASLASKVESQTIDRLERLGCSTCPARPRGNRAREVGGAVSLEAAPFLWRTWSTVWRG